MKIVIMNEQRIILYGFRILGENVNNEIIAGIKENNIVMMPSDKILIITERGERA